LDSVWINVEYNKALELLAKIEYELQFVALLKNKLPRIDEQRENFSYRHKVEFDVSKEQKVRLYIKKDCEHYIESLSIQKAEVEQKIIKLKQLGAVSTFNKPAYFVDALAKVKELLNLAEFNSSSVKDSLPKLKERGRFIQSNISNAFRKRSESEFNINQTKAPKILNKRDALEYLESLKMQRTELEIRKSVLAKMSIDNIRISPKKMNVTSVALVPTITV
jgi:hypothetical protein